MRKFETGATRDEDENKIDPEGFLSPLAIERYCQYMHAHRIQTDGIRRNSDNWTKGIPLTTYMKSMWRHFLATWKAHRGAIDHVGLEDSLCGVIFNAMGYLHELVKARQSDLPPVQPEAKNPSIPPLKGQWKGFGPPQITIIPPLVSSRLAAEDKTSSPSSLGGGLVGGLRAGMWRRFRGNRGGGKGTP